MTNEPPGSGTTPPNPGPPLAAVVPPRLTPKLVHERHGDTMKRFLRAWHPRRCDLEDLYQSVFLVILGRLASYSPELRPIQAWLFGICRHVMFSYFRGLKQSEALGELSEASEVSDGTSSLDDGVHARRSVRELRAILATVNEEHRFVFGAFEFEGFTIEEIAALLEVPNNTVRSRLAAVRKKVTEALLAREGEKH